MTTKVLEAVKENRVLRLFGGCKYYVAAVWQTIRNINSFEGIMASFDAQEWTQFENMYILAIGRSKYFGGGQMICPDAEIDGRQLDVCILNNMRLCELFLKFPFDIRSGSHAAYSQMVKVSALEIRAVDNKEVHVELDGEVVGTAAGQD